MATSSGRIGLYPGTFDPITNGHIDIITRAATHMVDQLIIAVARNAGKGPLFGVEDRVQMVLDEVAALPPAAKASITVEPFDGLLMDFAAQMGATLVIRGLRAVTDFEYEFQMAAMNSHLKPDIETVFLMASDQNQFIASSLVKEVARYGGDIRQFVPSRVADVLEDKFGVQRRTVAE